MTDLIEAIEAGRQAARQAKEDAYVQARRPIVNSYADQESQQKLAAGAQEMTQSAAQEGRAAAGETRAQGNQDYTDQQRAFGMAAQFTNKVADVVEANPNVKPSDVMRNAPPEVLKAIQLDTPEAQDHFAQIYDADPSQLRAHAEMYGGGKKVKSSVPATDKDGVDGYLQTFEDGSTHFVPGYKGKPTGAQGAYTVAGIRHAADGSVITDDSAKVASLAGAQAQARTVGTAQGKTTAEDIPISDTAARKLATSIVAERTKQAQYERSAAQAKALISDLSTGYAANIKVPGSPAYQLMQALAPLEAGATFEGMADLKGMSKTGASGLGALSDKEGELLRTLKGSLAAGQSKQIIQSNLDNFLQAHRDRLKAQEQAYLDNVGVSVDEGLHRGSRAPAAAAPAGFDAKTQALLDKYK